MVKYNKSWLGYFLSKDLKRVQINSLIKSKLFMKCQVLFPTNVTTVKSGSLFKELVFRFLFWQTLNNESFANTDHKVVYTLIYNLHWPL
jgi:hypothetical protein